MRAEPEREEAAMASTYSVPLSELVSEFDLNFFYKSSDYEKIHVTVDDVSRPGLHLTGFFGHFAPMRIYIELRGIGVINVAKLFGMGAVKDSCNIDLIINMVPWRDGEAYDRLGIETQYTEILDVKVPSITIPITPGRNLAVIFEVAAINNRQKRMGYNAALEFTEQMGKFFANKDD